MTKNLENMKIGIVIPVYNHSKTLRDVVIRALEVHDAVMVVDDGSTDGGIDTLAGLDVHIVQHERNSGKGAAILTAAKACRQLGMTHIATIDADGQHDPVEIRSFIPKV
ncbi:MAG: glycosyltransferase family 2 protein, partial [Desulfobacterales bacterium]